MADLKISQLTASTTPLAGTEVLPIVQSSTTKQVSVANLTAGRATSASSYTATQAYSNTSDLGFVASANIPGWNLRSSGGGRLSMVTGYIGANISSLLAGTGTNDPGTEVMRVTHSSGAVNFISSDVTLQAGNVIMATSGKGITTGSAIPLGFGVNGSTSQVTIDTSGNVLVNAASANAKFNTETTGNSVAGFFKNNTSGYQTVTVQNAGASGTRYLEWFVAGTTDVGYITSDGTGVTYATLSDYRLKDSPQPMTGALDKIAQLKPCTYTWKSSGETGQGFIAHELQSVFPDAVAGEKDGVDANGNPVYQGVDTSFLVATLVAAVQELQAKVAALEGK